MATTSDAPTDIVSSTKHNGLGTREALLRLHEAMNQEITQSKAAFRGRGNLSWLKDSFSFRSELSKMRWPSVVFMAAEALVHIIVAFVLQVDHLTVRWVSLHGFVLLLLLLFNLAVNLWDTRLRHLELLMKAEKLLELIKNCTQNRDLLRQWKYYSWQSSKPHKIFVPQSPCIHQQLTYRDKSCVNLPVYLLVTGDIIRLYPGDKAPGKCMSIKQCKVNQTESYSEQTKCAKSRQQLGDNGKQTNNNNKMTHKNNRDDVILLQEGEIFTYEAVTYNHQLKPERVLKETEGEKSNQKTIKINSEPQRIIHSFIKHDNESTVEKYFGQAKLKRAIDGVDFVMLSTPYIQSLKVSLRRSHDRPLNSVEKECFTISRKYFETLVIPLVFLFSTLVTAIHYGYLDLTDSDHKIKPISLAHLLLRPALTIMPFLPWMFPSLWLIINAYGSARLLCCRSAQPTNHSSCDSNNNRLSHLVCQQHKDGGSGFASDTGETGHNCNNPPATDSTENNNKINDESLNELKSGIEFNKIFRVFLDLISGQEGYVWRSSSLLQVLGSLTSLCCIDKVGILSWPNPSPEKVFFLTTDNNQQLQQYKHPERNCSIQNHLGGKYQRAGLVHSQSAPAPESVINDDSSLDQQMIDERNHLDNNDSANHGNQNTVRHQHQYLNQLMTSNCQVEVLDVTHNYNSCCDMDERDSQNHHVSKSKTAAPLMQHSNNPTSMLQFDDSNWQRYLNNLKPLGLSILMNNCCRPSLSDYYRFYKHISSQSALSGDYTPVIKRRCLCNLSKLIGFSKSATSNYAYCNQLALFRLIDPDLFKNGKLASSLQNIIGLKLPFPNMTCNVFKDTISGSYQIFSQGTADLILDSCAEYWDGQELCRLNDNIRRKILDFYQRTSLTSYCSAFSYVPTSRKYNFKNNYVEIQPDNSRLGSSIRRLNRTHETNLLVDFNGFDNNNTIRSNNFDRLTLSSQMSSNHLHPTGIHNCNLQQPNNNNNNSNRNSMCIARGGAFYPRFSATLGGSNRLGQHHLSLSSLDASVDSDLSDRLTNAININNTGRSYKLNQPKGGSATDRENQTFSSKKNVKLLDLNRAMDEVTDQVFVGMVAMQYQACPDFVALVEQLEQACIRFVHFSKENELRSRVFSEKMGLESGWNCHISLMSDEVEEAKAKEVVAAAAAAAASVPLSSSSLSEKVDKSVVQSVTSINVIKSCQDNSLCDYERRGQQICTDASATLLDIGSLERDISIESGLFIHNYRQHRLLSQQSASSHSTNSTSSTSGSQINLNSEMSVSGETSLISRWMSVPSLIMHMAANIGHHLRSPDHFCYTSSNNKKKSIDHSVEQHHHHHHHHQLKMDTRAATISGMDEIEEQLAANTVDDDIGDGIPMKRIYSASNLEQEAIDQPIETTEQFEPFAFDMSNRAKLPKGIENIRPHLDTVDNVPLQVSLFTDCTSELTHEMIKIMQDYGEIVCVIGSASSKMNTPVFLQANASIAIEPLEPQLCLSFNVANSRKTTAISRGNGEGNNNNNDDDKEEVDRNNKRLHKYRGDTTGYDSGFSGVDGGSKHKSTHEQHSSKQLKLSKSKYKLRQARLRRRLSKIANKSKLNQDNNNNKSPLLNDASHLHLEQAITKVGNNLNNDDDDDDDDEDHRASVSSSSSSSSSSSESLSKDSSDSDHERSSQDHQYSSSSATSSSESSSTDSCPSSLDDDDNNCFIGSGGGGVDSNNNNNNNNNGRNRSINRNLARQLPNPSALATKLASLPCSFTFSRKDPISLHGLIMEARHYTFKMKNCFVCMICFALSLSSAQFLTSILFLPPMLSSGLTIWLTVVVVPLMGFSLMGTAIDSQVMKIAVGKNLQLKPENIVFFVICYLIKFIPSIIVVVVCFGTIIAHSCDLTGFGSSSLGPCWMFTNVKNVTSGATDAQNDEVLWSAHLLTAQVFAGFLLVLYFVVISAGFVHRTHLIWQRSPTRNHLWVITSLVLLIGQILFSVLELKLHMPSSDLPFEFLASLPVHIWAISSAWPFLVISINVLVKRAEVKATIRQQRRARFDFNTKLGMNSPF